MVVMDERGGKIHATIKRQLLSMFKSILKEGVDYVMSNFIVGYNNGKYRTTKHKYMLNFMTKTSVVVCAHANISRDGFVFVPFAEIILAKDETYFVDVIGEVVGKGVIIESGTEEKKTRRMDILLEDLEKNKLSCTLWGEFADKMHSYMVEEIPGPIIIILQLCRVKIFKDEVKISNAYFGTKLMINPDIAVAIEFRNKLFNGEESYSQRISQISSQSTYSIMDNFLNQIERKTIDEIIESVEVQVKVGDKTGTTSFLIFDREAVQFLGKTASEIRDRIVEDGLDDTYLLELNEILEKKLLFKIQIKQSNIEMKDRWQIYPVVKIIDNLKLIDRFIATSQPEQDYGEQLIENLDVTSNNVADNLKESVLSETEVISPNKISMKHLSTERVNESISDEDLSAQLSTNKKMKKIKQEKE
uniref:Uncharacterized protein LOC105048395 n=1 Tax=Elaeis guineensis var. tenera TaxID=51953 RepID=A0A6I9RGP9_ELAGV|nr:uncharacterized protein LOC105048395 [Elaeis guineensis]